MVFLDVDSSCLLSFFFFQSHPASRRLSKSGDGFVRPFGGKGLGAFPGQTRREGFRAVFFWVGKNGGKRERNDANLGDSPLALCRAAGRGAPAARMRQGLLSLSAVGRLNLGIQDPRLGLRSARAWVLHALRPGLKKRVWAASRQGADGRRNGEKLGHRMAGCLARPFAFCRFDSTEPPCVFPSDIA